MPSSLSLNSRLFSSYKNHTTVKGLVGIAPSGAITFLSQLYSGNISDREIVEGSGILDLPFDDGNSVMADIPWESAKIPRTSTNWHNRRILEAWEINTCRNPLNRDDGTCICRRSF